MIDFEMLVKDLENKLVQNPTNTRIMNDLAIGYLEVFGWIKKGYRKL